MPSLPLTPTLSPKGRGRLKDHPVPDPKSLRKPTPLGMGLGRGAGVMGRHGDLPLGIHKAVREPAQRCLLVLDGFKSLHRLCAPSPRRGQR